MLFKKREQYKNASDCFFGEMKKGYIKGRQDLRKDINNMTDINKCIKILKKECSDVELPLIYAKILSREDNHLLEIIYSSLVWCKTEDINIPEEYFNILINPKKDLYDIIIEFAENILELLNFDENGKIGFKEFEIGIYKELLNAEKIRIQYIKGKMKKDNVSAIDNESYTCNNSYIFIWIFSEYMKKEPQASKHQAALSSLNTLPDDAFNKYGFSLFRPVTKK